jgi:sulfite reductase alpha subunit-like flavoprotein
VSDCFVTQAKNHGFTAKAIDLEAFDKVFLLTVVALSGIVTHSPCLLDCKQETLCDEKFVVFVMATFGEGEPTDNAVEFYNWFTSDECPTYTMNTVTFSVRFSVRFVCPNAFRMFVCLAGFRFG